MATNCRDSGLESMATGLQSSHEDDTDKRDHFKNNSTLILEPYLHQKKTHWPRDGRHILAQYDDQTVVVYQAFKYKIAKFAVENQR